MEEKILMATVQEVNTRGMKFTIDHIAARLGISKKTIYQYFSSKDVLITKATEAILVDIESQERDILADTKGDFAERIKDLMLLAPKKFGNPHDWVMEDIKKYRSGDWELIEQFKYERMLVLSEFLEEGIALGIVKKMNTKVVAKFLLGACRELSQDNFLVENNLNLIQARELLTDVFLHGFLIEKRDSK